MSDFLTRSTLISILIPLSFVLLRWLLPNKTTVERGYISRKEGYRRFWKIDLISLIAFFLLTIALVLLLHELFIMVANFSFSSMKQDGILIMPDSAIWLIVSIFLALPLSVIIVIFQLKIYLGIEYQYYEAYMNQKYNFNAQAALKIILGISFIFSFGIIVFGINNYSHFGEKDIVFQDFFQLSPQRYQYENITSIAQIDKFIPPNGEVVAKRHFIIVFSDASQWNSRFWPLDSASEKQIIQFVLQKTSLRMDSLDFEPGIK